MQNQEASDQDSAETAIIIIVKVTTTTVGGTHVVKTAVHKV